MEKQTLSIVMPNYNHARFLPEALEAILSQSYRPLEIIIIDDGSTDNSLEILKEYAQKEPLIRLIQNKTNMGGIYNSKLLMKMASGDYIYGAAADDKILPGFLEKSMKLLTQYPQAGLCSTLTRSIDENGNDKGVFPSPLVSTKSCYISAQESLHMLRKYGSWIKGNTTVYRRNALLDAGGFIPELESFTDGFIQQVIILKHGVCFIPKPLACVRVLPTSFSATNFSNIEHALTIANIAQKLMKSTYRDIFPSDYITEWKCRFLWSTCVSSWYRVRGYQEGYIKQDLSFQGQKQSKVLDHIFKTGFRLTIKMQAAAVLLYWGVKLRGLSCWLIHRWFNRAKSKDYPSI